MAAYVQYDIGDQTYALPAEVVVEVLHLVEITPIPDQAADHLGVMTLRGQTLPVIDLNQRYYGQPTPLNLSTPMIVLQQGQWLLAIVVGQVRDVVTLTDIPEPTPEKAIQGILRYQDETLLIPDIDALFADTLEYGSR
jgi:chemotaxis signal transduction protein